MNNYRHLVFGDSFINYLSLVKLFDVNKYSGKTLKGLTKKDSPIKKKIFRSLNKYNVQGEAIFCFGNVDLHLSFYYDIFKKPEYSGLSPENILDLWKKKTIENIKNYISVILKIKTRRNKTIMGVFPSVLKDEYISDSLFKYIKLKIDDLSKDEKKIFKSLIKYNSRLERYLFFNDILRKECKKHNLHYVDLDDIIFTKTKRVKKKFIDISPYNIHLTWEPLIIESQKHPFFNFLGITKENISGLEETQEKYLEMKRQIIKLNVTDPDYKSKKNKIVEKYMGKKNHSSF